MEVSDYIGIGLLGGGAFLLWYYWDDISAWITANFTDKETTDYYAILYGSKPYSEEQMNELIDRALKRAYEDYQSGKLSEEDYNTMLSYAASGKPIDANTLTTNQNNLLRSFDEARAADTATEQQIEEWQTYFYNEIYIPKRLNFYAGQSLTEQADRKNPILPWLSNYFNSVTGVAIIAGATTAGIIAYILRRRGRGGSKWLQQQINIYTDPDQSRFRKLESSPTPKLDGTPPVADNYNPSPTKEGSDSPLYDSAPLPWTPEQELPSPDEAIKHPLRPWQEGAWNNWKQFYNTYIATLPQEVKDEINARMPDDLKNFIYEPNWDNFVHTFVEVKYPLTYALIPADKVKEWVINNNQIAMIIAYFAAVIIAASIVGGLVELGIISLSAESLGALETLITALRTIIPIIPV